ncbi:MAG: DUF4870 domain-containing protein [Deltaproteobacteria bacterium]|nr:DUF4870 domain-containing protein [Deltaproteobacteria bacterium]MBI2500257.1 DUF4870 domain-containing protein [Deltaproteobacteria bacterium]MBI4196597.1 DUF4870 domain-containing protein [Deltaproteobacteria bacterium]
MSSGIEGTKGTGLAPNIAGMLCYIASPFTSLVFMFLEKENKEIQFHVWQSLLLSLCFWASYFFLAILSWMMGLVAGFLGWTFGLLIPFLVLLAMVLWIISMIKAYQGERWKVPYLGEMAEKQAGLA